MMKRRWMEKEGKGIKDDKNTEKEMERAREAGHPANDADFKAALYSWQHCVDNQPQGKF